MKKKFHKGMSFTAALTHLPEEGEGDEGEGDEDEADGVLLLPDSF